MAYRSYRDFTPGDLLTKALAVAKYDSEAAHVARLYYDGDHYQKGKQWVGPVPDPNVDSQLYADVIDRIERQFSSQNLVKELLDRHMGSVFGREPLYKPAKRKTRLEEARERIAERRRTVEARTRVPQLPGQPPVPQPEPNPEDTDLTPEQAKALEAEEVLVQWWDDNDVLLELQKIFVEAGLGTRSIARLRVPRGMLHDDGTFDPMELHEAWRFVKLECCNPLSAAVWTDPYTTDKIAIYSWTDEYDDEPYVEMSWIEREDEATMGQTVVAVMRPTGGSIGDQLEDLLNGMVQDPLAGEGEEEPGNYTLESLVRLPLNGNLMLYEVNLPTLVTPQIKQIQNQLNKALTMLGHNMDLAGFVERTMINAQQPGEYKTINGKKVFVPDPYQVGPATTNWLLGIEQKNSDGTTSRATPTIQYREPISPDSFDKTVAVWYRSAMREARQMHALISGDLAVAADSRRQAMRDFLTDLLATKTVGDAVLRWMLETVLSLSAYFADQPGYFDDFRIDAAAIIDPGPMDADETRVWIELVAAELSDPELAMSRIGIDDPAATLEKIVEWKKRKSQLNATVGGAIMNRFLAGEEDTQGGGGNEEDVASEEDTQDTEE